MNASVDACADRRGRALALVDRHSAIALYAMLLVMVIQAGQARSPEDISVTTPLPARHGDPRSGLERLRPPRYEPPGRDEGPTRFRIAAGFSALGFLPAVVVQSVLRLASCDAVRGERSAMWS